MWSRDGWPGLGVRTVTHRSLRLPGGNFASWPADPPGPQESWAGLGISAAAVVVMPLLAWRKRAANRTIQSPALRADIAESITCAYMGFATLAGVALSAVADWWWAEYVAAAALLVFIGREAWEALEAAREGGRRGDAEDE